MSSRRAAPHRSALRSAGLRPAACSPFSLIGSYFWQMLASLLTLRTPGSRSTANCFARQHYPVTRTVPLPTPAFVKKPAAWRVRQSTGDVSNCFPADKPEFLPEIFYFGVLELPDGSLRIHSGAPKNFISHPIADARKTVLQKQGRFDRQPAMALQKCAHHGGSKFG